MKILYYGSLAAEIGGPASVLELGIRGLRRRGAECLLVTPPLRPGEHRLDADFPVVTAGFRELPRVLETHPADLYHLHGIWSPAGHRICRYLQRRNRPYVITLHGTLQPGALAIKAMKKKLALWLYQGRDLRRAAGIQVACEAELVAYRDLGFTNPAVVIPHPVELPPEPPELPEPPAGFRIGFLGRLHPVKRVETLLYALAAPELRARSCELLIIGGGDEHYEAFLRAEVRRLGLRGVTFAGFLMGEAKVAALRSLSLLAVPSLFENFGINVVEGLREGVPVLASDGTPWADLERYGCGWHRPGTAAAFAAALTEAAALTPAQLREKGRRGWKLLREKFELDHVAAQQEAFYRRLLAGRPAALQAR